MINKLLSLFKKQTNYPPQVIPEKAATVLRSIEDYLNENKTSLVDSNFSIMHFEVTLADQFKSASNIKVYATSRFGVFDYIPRSIAFTIDQMGTWNFYIGVRRSDAMWPDEVKAAMFMDLLIRTNNAL